MMRSEIDVVTPKNLDEALSMLSKSQSGLRIVAGGSDVIVQLRDGVFKAEKLLNILLLKELRYVKKDGDRIHIGSLATYSDIVHSSLTRDCAWPLVEAARQIGAVQLQNTATLGGNLGNASPAGDSLPPLYALDAIVVTRSESGKREIPIEEFFLGYRKLDLRPDELIEEVYVEGLGNMDRGCYLKLGLREANAISIVDIAVVLRGETENLSFSDARVALGAVAPTIRRARKCEKALIAKPLTPEALKKAAPLAADDASPISDIRGSAQYRKEVVVSLAYEALYKAVYAGRGQRE
jgi:CO/xanthine dehydrogenase FAD-binding subunit